LFSITTPGGYDNLELSTELVRLPPDTTRLPLRLSFPEGNLIGLAKDKLPVDVVFASTRPLSFTASLDFLDESGRTFSLPVTGAADSCSLTHEPFMQVRLGRWDAVSLISKQRLGRKQYRHVSMLRRKWNAEFACMPYEHRDRCAFEHA
jgi:hypothetical protein